MKQLGLIKAMLLTHKADKITMQERTVLQNERLNELVSYAKKNSPYFRKLYANISEDFSLYELPTTNKIDMMSNFDEWVTDRSVTIKKVEEYMQNIDNVGRMIDKKYLVFTTSGSTGNPAIVLYDKTCISVVSAVAAFRTFARKEDLKTFMKNGKRTAGLFANHGFYLACGMSRYTELKMHGKKNRITVDVLASTEEIVNQLNDFKPSMFSGYPSSLYVLAEEQKNAKLNISPDIIITGGECLTDTIRDCLSKTFGCYVQTHYSCTEAGEIACECSEKHLHINDDWIIVEAVDENYNPVPYGKQSAKLLITNLSNYIQPFIRYEVTDRVIIHNEPCTCGKSSMYIEIEGRTDDVITFSNGIKIAPMSFYKILEEVKEMKRFQLVYRGKDELELRMIAEDRITAFEKSRKSLEKFLATKNITPNIILSNEIPKADKRSGKYKHVYKL